MRLFKKYCQKQILFMAVLSLSFLACATVSQPEISQERRSPSISPTLENSSDYLLKRKVVIARFSNETTYGKSVLLDDTNLLEKQASDILYTKLGEAQKFVLFERHDTQNILQALDTGQVDKLGLPADYLIVGSVTEFGRETTGKTGFFSRTKMQRAHARVNIRIVNAKTSQVIFATDGAGEAEVEVGTVFGVGTQADYDSTLNDKAISAAISKVVSNLVENLLEQPWHSYILAMEPVDSQMYVVIGGGASQGLKKGHKLSVWKKGNIVHNPQTGLPLEMPGTKIATIEIESTFGNNPANEGSRCVIVYGSIPSEDWNSYIVKEEKP